MKKTIFLLMMILAYGSAAFSQKYMTRTGKITFFSSTQVENIEAVNNEVACITDMKTGAVTLQLLIKSFKFEKALMQEHFNENYMESDKFPKSTFKGTIADLSALNLSKDGVYKLTLSGDLTMHGVTNYVTVPVTISVKNTGITATTSFKVKPEDYKISIPSVVAAKIAKEIEISANMLLTQPSN